MAPVTFVREAFAGLEGSVWGFATLDGGRCERKIGKGGTVSVDEQPAIDTLRADPDWLEQVDAKPAKGTNPDGTPVNPPEVVGSPAPGTSEGSE